MKLEAILQKLGLLQTGKIMYIGGSDVLPAPLKPEQERQAVAALEQGDEAAKQLLIEHNLRLVVYIARRFENTGVNLEDLISIGTIGLIKAVNTFRPDRNIKLATYSSRCIENEILMHIRKSPTRRRRFRSTSRSIPTGTATSCCCPMCSAQTAISLCGRWRTTSTTSFFVRRSDASRNGKADRLHALRPRRAAGEDAEGGRGYHGHFAVVYFQARKAHHAAPAPRDLTADLQLRGTCKTDSNVI